MDWLSQNTKALKILFLFSSWIRLSLSHDVISCYRYVAREKKYFILKVFWNIKDWLQDSILDMKLLALYIGSVVAINCTRTCFYDCEINKQIDRELGQCFTREILLFCDRFFRSDFLWEYKKIQFKRLRTFTWPFPTSLPLKTWISQTSQNFYTTGPARNAIMQMASLTFSFCVVVKSKFTGKVFL